jgi:hypothetical protein
MALAATGWIESVVIEIWSILQDQDDFNSPGQLDIDDQRTNKALCNLLKVLTTFSGLKACLEYEERNKKIGRGTLTEFIQSLMCIDLNGIYVGLK